MVHHEAIGEIVAPHYDIRIGNETVCFIYEPLACHSYNIIKIGGMKVKIATIDTMLSFYLAFLYTDRPYYDEDRILCMCEFLFSVQQKNRLEQKGVLKRFSINCYGKQTTIGDARVEKAHKYQQLKEKRGSDEWDEWFLRYMPKEHATPSSKVMHKKKTKRVHHSKHGKKEKKGKKTKKNKGFFSN